jgi:hypothetical protein
MKRINCCCLCTVFLIVLIIQSSIAEDAAYTSLNDSIVTFNSNAADRNVTVTSNTSWTVSTSESWVSASAEISGDTSGNGNVTITCTENTGPTERTGMVYVHRPGGYQRGIRVTQPAAVSYANRLMTMRINGHNYQVHDFISDTINKTYASHISEIYTSLLAAAESRGANPHIEIPQAIKDFSISLDASNTGSLIVNISNFEVEYDQGPGYCDLRQYYNFRLVTELSSSLMEAIRIFIYLKGAPRCEGDALPN